MDAHGRYSIKKSKLDTEGQISHCLSNMRNSEGK